MDYGTHITALSQFRLTLTHPVSRDGFEEPPLGGENWKDNYYVKVSTGSFEVERNGI